MKKTIASAAALAAAVIGTGTVNSIANADTIEPQRTKQPSKMTSKRQSKLHQNPKKQTRH
jgi:hypothetical protein